MLKIYGQAPSCARGIEGSGFVYSPQHVLTNAHVVAGTDQVSVVTSRRATCRRTSCVYDPRATSPCSTSRGCTAPPLRFARAPAGRRTRARSCSAIPRTARSTSGRRASAVGTNIVGHDIYGNGGVAARDLLDPLDRAQRQLRRPADRADGTVLGMVFATALDSSDTGFVLTDAEVAAGPPGRGDRAAVAPVADTAELHARRAGQPWLGPADQLAADERRAPRCAGSARRRRALATRRRR